MKSSECLFSLVKRDPRIKIDPEDLRKFGVHNCSIGTTGYLIICISHKQYRLHRVIMGNPDGVVDHINGNSLDCRKENLRVCSQADNARNRGIGSNNKSGYKGVFLAQGKYWAASIVKDRKKIHIGYYKTPELAALAYNKKATELYGEFANLNIIPGDLNG